MTLIYFSNVDAYRMLVGLKSFDFQWFEPIV